MILRLRHCSFESLRHSRWRHYSQQILLLLLLSSISGCSATWLEEYYYLPETAPDRLVRTPCTLSDPDTLELVQGHAVLRLASGIVHAGGQYVRHPGRYIAVKVIVESPQITQTVYPHRLTLSMEGREPMVADQTLWTKRSDGDVLTYEVIDVTDVEKIVEHHINLQFLFHLKNKSAPEQLTLSLSGFAPAIDLQEIETVDLTLQRVFVPLPIINC